jgi:hypothetical protein
MIIMVKKALKLLRMPTPRIGKNLRNAGLALIGGGSTGLVASTQLPEVPDSWMQFAASIAAVISAISVLIGTILTGMGQGQVHVDPDTVEE